MILPFKNFHNFLINQIPFRCQNMLSTGPCFKPVWSFRMDHNGQLDNNNPCLIKCLSTLTAIRFYLILVTIYNKYINKTNSNREMSDDMFEKINRNQRRDWHYKLQRKGEICIYWRVQYGLDWYGKVFVLSKIIIYKTYPHRSMFFCDLSYLFCYDVSLCHMSIISRLCDGQWHKFDWNLI